MAFLLSPFLSLRLFVVLFTIISYIYHVLMLFFSEKLCSWSVTLFLHFKSDIVISSVFVIITIQFLEMLLDSHFYIAINNITSQINVTFSDIM